MAGQFDRIVMPGETGKIPISIKTTNGSGRLAKSITVSTNIQSSAKATITLNIQGEVWQPVQVEPRSAAFGRITIDTAQETPTRKLTIVNNVEGDLKLADIQSTNPAFQAEVTPIEPGRKYELTVSIVEALKSGNNAGKINISTGIAETPTLVVPVYAYITSPVDVTPAQLALPVVRSEDLTRHFYVRSNNNKPLKISDLKSSSPDLKLQLTDIRNSLTYRLTVDVPASYKPGDGNDTISFKTDNGTVPVVSIPITDQRPVAKRPTQVSPAAARNFQRPAGASLSKPTDRTSADASKPIESAPPAAKEKEGSQPAGN